MDSNLKSTMNPPVTAANKQAALAGAWPAGQENQLLPSIQHLGDHIWSSGSCFGPSVQDTVQQVKQKATEMVGG